MSLWVKICAMTNAADAAAAAEADADAIGLIFAAASKRKISFAQAREIGAAAGDLERIGLFHGANEAEILRGFDEAALTGLQLHGQETSDLVMHLRERLPQARIIKSLQFSGFSIAVAREMVAAGADNILIDSAAGSRGGGTGERFDWKAGAELAHSLGPQVKVIVAGGLAPNNVAEAVTLMAPWGVDVVSGVEAIVGKKDAEKVREFVKNARRATDSLAMKAERSRA